MVAILRGSGRKNKGRRKEVRYLWTLRVVSDDGSVNVVEKGNVCNRAIVVARRT